jgi:hypothetical protein
MLSEIFFLALEAERVQADQQPTYVVRLQAQPGIDAVKALRWILKISLRPFGLKCVGIAKEPEGDGEGGAPNH